MLFALPEPKTGTEWLYEAIRISFRSHVITISSSNSTEPAPPRDPRFAKLIEELRWSKRFILTYQILVVGFILIAAGIHWFELFLRWRKRSRSEHGNVGFQVKAIRDENDGSSSSGSSTLGGHESPLRKVSGEETPLLTGLPSTRTSILAKSRAFLLYQPRPIPIIHKTLPSNGTSICILLFLGIQLFYLLYRINFSWFELFVFADRAGQVFAMNLPILYLLVAKTSILRVLTGYSYESLNLVHRRLGEVMCSAALLHALGMVGVWYTLFSPRMSFIKFLLEKIVLLGVGAFFAYEVLYLTSCTCAASIIYCSLTDSMQWQVFAKDGTSYSSACTLCSK